MLIATTYIFSKNFLGYVSTDIFFVIRYSLLGRSADFSPQLTIRLELITLGFMISDDVFQ